MTNVVAALIEFNGKYFIGKRISGEPTGLYEFPGGKVEQNETKEEAIIREIKEELNVSIKIVRYLGNTSYEYPKRTIHLDLYLCKYICGEIKLNSHSEYHWIDLKDLNNYKMAPADQKIIKKLNF